jgi:hypothetical protein
MINRLDPYSLPKRHLNWVILRFLMRGKAPSEDQNLAFMRLALYGVRCDLILLGALIGFIAIAFCIAYV